MMKKLISMALAVILLVSCIPVPARAAEVEETSIHAEVQEIPTEDQETSNESQGTPDEVQEPTTGEEPEIETEPVTEPVCEHTGGSANCSSPAICEICGYAYGETNTATHVETEIRDSKEFSCTEDGYSGDIYCAACGEKLAEGEILPASHKYMETVVPATFTRDGYTEYTCVCGDTYAGDTVKAQGLPKPVVVVTPDAKTGGATLTWEHIEEADAYKVYRATSSKGKYTLLATVKDAAELKVSAGVGKKYYYKVVAVCEENTKLNSGYSAVVSFTGKCVPPAVNAEVNGSTGKPVISWKKVSGAQKYYVYRVNEAGERTRIANTTKTSYTDNKAAVGTAYTYQVRAIGSKSSYNSEFSDSVSCTPICARPSVKISISSATGKAKLTWNAISGAVSYDIYRAGEDGEFSLITNQSTTGYEDLDAAADTVYFYKVAAVAENPELSNESAEKKAQTIIGRPEMTAGVDSVSGKPRIFWNEVEGATEYKVYRSAKSTKSYKCIATISDLEFIDTSVTVGKSYYYKVMAVSEQSESAYSAYKKASGKLGQPVVTAELSSETGKPVLNWEKVSGAKQYSIYTIDENGAYIHMANTKKTEYSHADAAFGTEHVYLVMAIASSKAYNSEYSEPVSCKVACTKPVIEAKIDDATGKAIVYWKNITGAVSYDVYRAGEDGVYTFLANTDDLRYLDKNTFMGDTYWYKVVAIAEDPTMNSEESEAQKVYVTIARPTCFVENELETGKAMIIWNPVKDAVSYEIYRSDNAEDGYDLIATVETDEEEPCWIDENTATGEVYYYKMIAVGTDCRSEFSNSKTFYGRLGQVKNFNLTNDPKTGKPVLTWDELPGAREYEISRVTTLGVDIILATTTKLTYTDDSAEYGSVYNYRVKALGTSEEFNGEYCGTKLGFIACEAPVASVKADSNTGAPVLKWKAVNGAESYDIYRAEADGEYELICSQTETSYTDPATKIDTQYNYKVQAMNHTPQMNSAESEPVQFTTGVPTPQIAIEADPESGNPVVSWISINGVVEYEVFRATKASGTYKSIGKTVETSFKDESAVPGKVYYYKVTAIGKNKTSERSDYKKEYGHLAKPVVSITLTFEGCPVVMWEGMEKVSKYNVYRADSEDGEFEYLGKSTYYNYLIDETADLGNTYYYKVKAYPSNSNGASAFSDVISVEAKGPEDLDLEALNDYGNQYAVETYGFEIDTDVYDGYYPGLIEKIGTMEDAKCLIRDQIDYTVRQKHAAGYSVEGLDINVRIEPYTGLLYDLEDRMYIIRAYYG